METTTKTIAFKTFGCKANSVDTDALYHEARRRGFSVVDDLSAADAYVINSCTVTSHADRDARTQALRYKRQNPRALIGVVGCYAQVAKDELLALPEVDFVVGTANKARMLDHFSQAWETGEWQKDQVETPKGYLPEIFPGSRNSRASVKIQDGCNFSCSFCIIPKARGRSRSLSLEVIAKQVDDAYTQGFREVVLTGIHIAHYGWDLGTDLMALLKLLLRKPQGPRIRISTLDPFEIPDEMIAMIGSEERLCPHFHIALQSGSDKVLGGMRRIYKASEFVESTQKIKLRAGDTFIGVDVIVGFHGEEEKDFRATIQCLEDSYWTKLHVFPFSVRRGTRAETMSDAVASFEISERSKILRDLSDKMYHAFLDSQVGRVKQVLLERPAPKQPHLWQGHTENYLPTLSRAPEGEARGIVSSVIGARRGDRVETSPQ